MRLKPQHCALFSVLTFAAACSDDPIAPLTTGGSGGGGGGGEAGSSSAGSSSAGMTAGGTSAGSSGAGSTSMAGKAGAPTAGGVGGGGSSGAGGGGAGGAPPAPVCGNGMKEGAEACDDGDTMASDGCSATCTVETGYVCNTPGQACTPVCGDGTKIAPETCDDDNTAAGDGCSAMCMTESGWECPTAGMACESICGDGILVSGELCDDKNDDADDGCDDACEPEPGFVCDVPGEACRTQPDCTGGVCTSSCGDGLVIGEDCDDGNALNDDGCSDTCEVEPNFTCKTMAAPLPMQLAIPVTYRDFIGLVADGSTKHPDFQAFDGGGITPGMVESELVGGLPVYTGNCEAGSPGASNAQTCPHQEQTSSEAAFDQWYRDAEGVNLTFPGVVMLSRQGQSQSYVFDGGQTFTPLTGKGWDAQGKEGLTANKNFGFTTVLRYFFLYQGDETLEFSGDDDVWVFINNKLAVDIGGLHPKQTKSITLGVQVSEQLGLETGNVYEMALFHAERSPAEANFKLTLNGFLNNKSVCTAN